jgi:hypothetical protein
MFAQSVLEYGGLGASIAGALQRAWYSVSEVVGQLDSRFLWLGAVGLIAWASVRFLSRR